MKESRKVYGWLVRGGIVAVGAFVIGVYPLSSETNNR